MISELLRRNGQHSAELSRLAEAAFTAAELNLDSQPKRSVLVVDDDPDIHPLVAIALDRYDLAMKSAEDGATALLRLHAGKFNLIILDLGMAEVDGFAVLQVLKRDPRLWEI